MKAKLLSLVLAGAVLIAPSILHIPTDVSSGSASLFVISLSPIFVLFGVISIWLSDLFGGFTGTVFRGGYVDSPTPAVCFVALGYFMLSLPIIALLFCLIGHRAPHI